MVAIKEIDASGWLRASAALSDKLHLELPRVIRKEAGALVQTLVRVSPPAEPAKSRERIGKQFHAKFELAESGEKQHAYTGGQISWYAWTPQHLYGVAEAKDMTKASEQEIYRLGMTLTTAGRQKLSFKHTRHGQNVILSQRVLAKPSTVNRAIKMIQQHVGRLKAAWLVGVRDGIIQTAGDIPQWIQSTLTGARGNCIDGLSNKEFPNIALRNFAAGIRTATWLVQRALNLRSKAMATNLRLMLSGKKNISDYL